MALKVSMSAVLQGKTWWATVGHRDPFFGHQHPD
jgi:hypothetical protein